jgi:AcrR family transcriptional regulator
MKTSGGQKQRILEAAATMFLEEGTRSVRMDDISARLGVSKRTLYEMFDDKQELLEDSLAWYFENKRQEITKSAAGAANVIEEIFMILGFLKRDEKDEMLIGNLKKFYPQVYGRLQKEMHEFSHSEFDRLLDRGIAEKLFPEDMNRELALMTVTYTMSALAERRYPHFPEHVSPHAAFEYVFIHFFRGLATRKGIEVIDELAAKYRNKNEKQI